jgi:hypothetical protein
MKIFDLPPWRAYVCIAFFNDAIEGALNTRKTNELRKGREKFEKNAQYGF